MKYLGVIALAIIACSVASTYAQSHNIVWGSIRPGDNVLHQQVVSKKSKILRIVTEDVTYPLGGMPLNRVITGIRVIDQYANGKGGYATLYAGGPGYPHVTIHFKSQRGNGFNFLLQIFGR